MLVTLIICLPIGVAAAIYLEEFAPKNRWTDIIEVNINNLAAVPSIIFGLLGLAIFLNFFGLPALVAAGRRPGARAARPADDHHRLARRPEGRAAVDPRSRARRRRIAPAGGLPPCAAARHARRPHRHDHRHGPRPRRDRAAAPHRHGRLHRRRARTASPTRRRSCRCRSSSGRTCPRSASRPRPRRRSSCFCCSC